MPGMAATVSVLCVRPSLCHVCFFREKTTCVLFFTLFQVLLCFFYFLKN